MSKKVDERIPREVGSGMLPDCPAAKSPWNKLVSYVDAAHYSSRYNAVFSASALQVLRILVPDYKERATLMSENAYKRLYQAFTGPYGSFTINEQNTHPFFRGNFTGGLTGDAGDDALLMCGRVNDFGTYRVEKELDVCHWDIVGSDLCRATTQSLQATADGQATHLQPGTRLDYCMVEARGCGDLHCRIVAESRDKYPMPEHEIWESFGPIATEDQIRYTPEEDMLTESQVFREECGNTFCNGTCWERDASSVYKQPATAASTYIFPAIEQLIAEKKFDEKFVSHVIKCVFEASGKSAFGEFYAKEGLRNWLGVPDNIDDGRVIGGHIEMFLQCLLVKYEVEAFNSEEVIYVIDRNALTKNTPRAADAFVSMWYGMTKTLVSARWSLWEEPDDTPADKLRIKIAKKIDKFC